MKGKRITQHIVLNCFALLRKSGNDSIKLMNQMNAYNIMNQLGEKLKAL